MATKRLVAVDPVALLPKKQHSGEQIVLLSRDTTHGMTLKLAGGEPHRERITAFDPSPFLLQLVTDRGDQKLQRSQSVFSQGDAADAVYYIRSGKVKLTVVSELGKEAVVAILPEDNFFGEGCLMGQSVRTYTASAVQRSTITRVEKSVMLGLLHHRLEFAGAFVTYLLSRNVRMEADLVDHLFNSAEKRLARLLLLLGNVGQETTALPIATKISQETLAEMVGTTRSRVCFFMNRFRELGFIEYNGGGIHIRRSLASVVLHC